MSGLDKDDLLQMIPSITRYRNEISGVQALAVDRRSRQEEMIEPGAAALMYEAYKLVAANTNPHYALAVIQMLSEHMIDIRNMMEKHENSPWQGM